MKKSNQGAHQSAHLRFMGLAKEGRSGWIAAFSLSLALIVFSSPFGFADRRHHDVEDIGNRNINGRILGIFPNFVSLEREIQLGAQVAEMLEQHMRLVEDPAVNDYIDRLGQHLVRHSDAKVPFVIKVIDTDEVNAFALPGGYFYVNKGLILEAETEAELAGVMAHEIAHVAARHGTERMTKGQERTGKGELTAAHEGFVYRFASQTERSAFKASPDKYAVQDKGLCPVAKVMMNREVPGDPEIYSVHNQKIYLLTNQEAKQMFDENPSRFTPQAKREGS